MKAFVVAISGIPGSGSSAICDELCRQTERSAVLHFDEFHMLSESWLRSGGDFDRLDLGKFKADAEKLTMNRKYECVFLDYPLGRCVKAMNSVIDFVFYVDAYPDLALASAINQLLKTADANAVRTRLRLYQEFGYEINRKIMQAVPPGADVRLLAGNSLDDIVNTTLEFMKHLLINRYVLW